MNDMMKTIFLWLFVAFVLMNVFTAFAPQQGDVKELEYSNFIKTLRTGTSGFTEVELDEQKGVISGKYVNGGEFRVDRPTEDPELINDLVNSGIDFDVKEREGRSILLEILISSFPILIIAGIWIYFMRQMNGGGGKNPMSFGKSKARMLSEDQVKVTFKDVAGVDEAKEEVGELVEFLREPVKFQKLGGKIPRGILMVGAPGTGKTLLAKAIAGEAKVPFFTISGSDFVEMFVGVGASRVRDMFEQAKKHAPCIIFIDEIDAVGRHRGAGVGGGNDEREQTLNQLLVEMDGFEGNEGAIVIAATNRPDVLDPALLRPGRFDRQVVVPLPDIRGREQILNVHLGKVPAADDVKSSVIARGTPGFSGADLANLVNEAALFAARENKRLVEMEDMEKAKDKILMGTERKSMVMSEKEKKNTAYHEAGHAVVGRLVPEHDPVYKVSIIPRGRALGVTMFLPEEDKYSNNKRQLESQMSTLYGGRIAEEMTLGAEGVTTGASNDIQRATEIAHNMVTKWGLSDNMGPMSYGEEEGEIFLGRSVTQYKSVSDLTAKKIDEDVRTLVNRNYQRAEQILKDNIDKLHAMAELLMKYETIDNNQIDAIMEGREPGAPKGWTDDSSAPPSSSTSTDSDADKDVSGEPADQLQ